METPGASLLGDAPGTSSLNPCSSAAPAGDGNNRGCSGGSYADAQGADGQYYMEMANAKAVSITSHSQRMQAYETRSAGSFVETPNMESKTSGMPTFEELLDGPTDRLNSMGAVPTSLSPLRPLVTGLNDISGFQTVIAAVSPAHAERAAAGTGSTERSTEATASADYLAIENLFCFSSPSRAADTSAIAPRSAPRDVVAAAPDHFPDVFAGPVTSGVSQVPTVPHPDHGAAAASQTITDGSIVPQIPFLKKNLAHAEIERETQSPAAANSIARVVPQSAGCEQSLSSVKRSKLSSRGAGVTSAYTAGLLRSMKGASSSRDPAATDTYKKGAVHIEAPSETVHDLPLGLLLLYCAAEDMRVTGKSATTSSAHTLISILENIADLHRRDRRRAAQQHASEVERSRCEELYNAAIKKRALDAAKQASRAQVLEQEERVLCTFHPAISKRAQRMEAKGTKKFMKKCLEWKAAVEQRRRQKCVQLAEIKAGKGAAAASKWGMSIAHRGITKQSLRLLAHPRAQERLKSRPCLWEARRPCRDLQEDEGRMLVSAHALAGTTALAHQLFGSPITSSTAAEQDALLRALRRPTSEAEVSVEFSPLLLQNTPASRASKTAGGTLKGFLSRLAEDAERREEAAATLQARRNNTDSERFEIGTGKPLFRPNALPTVWKDGHRVGYDDLSKEEQREFSEGLRRAGLDFVLWHHLREKKASARPQCTAGVIHGSPAPQGGGLGSDGAEGDATLGHSVLFHSQQGDTVDARHSRFMMSLEAAMARKRQNWEQILAQATEQETFHPHITKRSAKMALHKTGGVPIFARPVNPERESSRGDMKSGRSLDAPSPSTPRCRPLSERTEFFLARNKEWMESRKRRLQYLAKANEERLRAGCTFTPNRHVTDASRIVEPSLDLEKKMVTSSAKTNSLTAPCPTTGGAEAYWDLSKAQMRPEDMMASAADVRVINELEVLRSSSAYRDEGFLKSVCESSGLTDPRLAMANLSLHSAPRLTRNIKGRRGASSPRQQAFTSFSQSPLSPIPRQRETLSSSPYSLRRRNTCSPPLSQPRGASIGARVHSQKEWSQPPVHHSEARATAEARSFARRFASSSPPLENPWATLDAQIDAILNYQSS